MKIVSVRAGLPRDVVWHGRTVTTALYKDAVEERIPLRRLTVDGVDAIIVSGPARTSGLGY